LYRLNLPGGDEEAAARRKQQCGRHHDDRPKNRLYGLLTKVSIIIITARMIWSESTGNAPTVRLCSHDKAGRGSLVNGLAIRTHTITLVTLFIGSQTLADAARCRRRLCRRSGISLMRTYSRRAHTVEHGPARKMPRATSGLL
jgi:hypothetical protein